MELFWFIPTEGDGRYLGTATGGRTTAYRYLRQVAEAADELGYGGVLLPTGRFCEDAWVMASSLVHETERLKFLVAVRPGVVGPTTAARMARTFDRVSGGRLLVNVVTGGDPVELGGDGVFLDHAARYRVTDEFLTVWKRLMADETVTFSGEHLSVREASLLHRSPHAAPPIFFGGSSPAAHDVVARHADVYLSWGEPPEQLREKISDVRRRAAAVGRTVRFGIRLHVIVRDTEAEAWAESERLLRYVTPEAIEAARGVFARSESEGQKRMAALHESGRRPLEVSPNLWAGIGLVRGGAGTALVGSATQVAARLLEYSELGIETFILSGYPHLEEAYRVAESLFPVLPVPRPSKAVHASDLGPGGQVIAFNYLPKAAATH